mmetsp:Transcript_1911/g.3346  ORF Transcript_1911/g.3346 Transcript_1911/m.3346 type:complete len:223 (-) Transcript_1911:1080-1748(-)
MSFLSTSSRSLLPAIVVNSPGTDMIASCLPIKNIWRGMIFAVQSYGKDISPVGISTGLGAWQSWISWDGDSINLPTTAKKSPSEKASDPGPSVVPAVNEFPSAALHVRFPLTLILDMSRYVWAYRMGPSMVVFTWLNTSRAVFACLEPMMAQDWNGSSDGPFPTQNTSFPPLLQVEVLGSSHDRPVPSSQNAPRTLGDTSPKLVDANAATKFGKYDSNSIDA